MKKTLLAVATGSLILGQTMPAQAINREWSAALGFLGGVVTANAFGGHRTVVQERVYCPPPVYRETVVVRQPMYCPPPVIVEQPVVTGHYEWREQQVWMPGRWVTFEGCGGQLRQEWQPGYYRTERVQVWVQDSCHQIVTRRHSSRW